MYLSADKSVSEWLPFIQRVVPLTRACFVSLRTPSAYFSAPLSQPQSGSGVRWCSVFWTCVKRSSLRYREKLISAHRQGSSQSARRWNNEGESHVCGENLGSARQVWKDTGWSKRLALLSRDELDFFFFFSSLYQSRHGVSLNMVQAVRLCCNVSQQWQGKCRVSCCPYLAKEGLVHTVSAYFCGTDLFLKNKLIVYLWFFSLFFFLVFDQDFQNCSVKKTAARISLQSDCVVCLMVVTFSVNLLCVWMFLLYNIHNKPNKFSSCVLHRVSGIRW